jgi:hypothetical protein
MNDLETLAQVFERADNEISVDPAIGEQAMIPLRRMLAFASELQITVKGNAGGLGPWGNPGENLKLLHPLLHCGDIRQTLMNLS